MLFKSKLSAWEQKYKITRLEKDQYGNCFKVIKGRYFIISLEEYNQLLKDMLEDE